jgi:retron-type reverse transcriptase
MSKGINPETLDGINHTWYEKTVKDLKAGKFNFQPSRRVKIPKAGKKELRPLSVGNPRDKIIQKAITVVLEAIWVDKFSDDSYGIRPKRSLQQALYQLYRNGSNYQ